MIFELKLLIGYVSGAIVLIACLSYIYSIVKGKTTSNRITWGIWALSQILTLLTYYGTNGWVSSIWVYVAYFFGTFAVFVFLLIYSRSGDWTWFEKAIIGGVILTVIGWIIFRSSELAMTLILLTDIFGSILLVKTVYFHPESEYAIGWYLGFLGNFLNLFAVEIWNYDNAAYPIYLVLLTFIVCILITFPTLFRHKTLINDPEISKI